MKLHYKALELSGMSKLEHNSAPIDVGDLDPKMAIERACSATKMSNTLVAAKKYYGDEAYYKSEAVAFPAELHFQDMASLWACLSSAVEVKPLAGDVYWSEKACPNSMPWASVEVLARFLTQMNFIAGSFLYLNADYLTPGIDFLDNNAGVVKANVAVAIENLEEQIQLARTNMKEADAIPGAHLKDLKFEYSDCCSWIENAFVVLGSLKKPSTRSSKTRFKL